MIELQHLTKRFATQGGTVVALNDINLTIRDGDVYGIIGMSGAGKSTLVRCINMLERPDEGNVIVNGKQMQDLRAADLRAARREITMIFQQFNLLMQRTCLRNIMFPMELAKVPKDKAEARARELLELVGLPDKADAYPAQLSGGQKQRIAIARALATDPKVLLCDEATSALDPNTTQSILRLLKEINQTMGVTVVIITHEMRVIERICHRVAVIDQSRIVEMGDVQVSVLGTTFDASNRTEEGIVSASLVEGSVAFRAGNQNLRLTPSRRAVYHVGSGEITVSEYDPEITTAWKDNLFRYKSLTLEEVLEQLSARYDVRIITDAGDVGRTRFSGALETRLSVEQALDIVSRQTGMEWSKLDNVYFVTKR